jgi:hypothetical protein
MNEKQFNNLIGQLSRGDSLHRAARTALVDLFSIAQDLMSSEVDVKAIKKTTKKVQVDEKV